MAEQSLAEKYFDEVVVDDKDEMEAIAEMARPEILKIIRIDLGNNKVPIAIYEVIFECIMRYLKQVQKKKDSLRIIICDRLEIGFTTSFETPENEELEKMGNFMIYMNHIDNKKKSEIDEDEDDSVVRCVQWNESNITTSLTDIKEITKMAVADLEKKLGIMSVNAEVVMPLFCLIHDEIVKYVAIVRNEKNAFEYRINVAGCYDIYARLLEDGVDISFKPCVYGKGYVKEDGDATAKYE